MVENASNAAIRIARELGGSFGMLLLLFDGVVASGRHGGGNLAAQCVVVAFGSGSPRFERNRLGARRLKLPGSPVEPLLEPESEERDDSEADGAVLGGRSKQECRDHGLSPGATMGGACASNSVLRSLLLVVPNP